MAEVYQGEVTKEWMLQEVDNYLYLRLKAPNEEGIAVVESFRWVIYYLSLEEASRGFFFPKSAYHEPVITTEKPYWRRLYDTNLNELLYEYSDVPFTL